VAAAMISIVPGIINITSTSLNFSHAWVLLLFSAGMQLFFFTRGQNVLTEPCYKKNAPLNNQLKASRR